ncbi:Mechanosensitive ion channel-domain-containing protein [Dissophora ornata]|nr:Mechanosensitive ion channel-domain-containing protein [Dissophora ornata]
MNSDESDFDWDEDINIDDSGQVHKKSLKGKTSKWRKLSPFLRMVILILVGSPILALPAILVSTLMANDPPLPDPTDTTTPHPAVPKATITLIFVWLSFMWGIIFLTNWGIDIVPVVVVRLSSVVTSSRLENVKSRLLIFVATKKYLKWLLASCWSIGSFAFLSKSPYSRTDEKLNPVFVEVLAAIVAACALIFVEKILLHMISTNFHQTAYADRIKENKYALSVLDRLSTSKKNVKKIRPTHSRHNTTDNMTQSSRNSTLVSNTGRTHHYHHRGSRQKPNQNIFQGINRRLHGIALANKSSPSKDIGSTANAKRLAKTLFYNLQTNSEELVVQDFYPYFNSGEEAQAAFTIFDKDGNGDISKSEMKEKIFYVYKERKDLHTSLRDLSQAVGKLDVIFLTVVTVVWLLIVLSIFGKDVVKNMLSIGSFLVALSFVFGNSLKILFENIVFLFITHPYDSGDLVSIDDGDSMYVREVGLNSTTFVTWDGKRMYYPNNLISQKPIHNVRRSPNMTDKIVLNIDCYTPQSKILELRARMRDYLIKENKEFLPDLEIQIQEMDLKLKISMCIEHKGNWQDSGRRWARRTAFNYALKEAVEEIGIKYSALPQRLEVYKRDFEEIEKSQNPNLGDQHTATLGLNSSLRQYSPEHVARLYRRPTINKPEGE